MEGNSPASNQDGPVGVDGLRDLMGELRGLARQLLLCESGNHSLTPTALALTALRRAKRTDVDWDDIRWENRRHFFYAISQAMRHALVDYARRRGARGRDRIVYLPPGEDVFLDLPGRADNAPDVLLRVEEAMTLMARENPELAELLSQFYFAGYTVGEIARFSGDGEKTVDRKLKRARVLARMYFEKCPPS